MSAINNTFTDNFIFFWQLGEPNDYLSNWYPAPFVSEGIRYVNTEQYMMAKKALLFKDFAVYSRILEVTDPAKIKYYGKLVGGFDAATWNKAKEEIMLNGNLASSAVTTPSPQPSAAQRTPPWRRQVRRT